MITPQAKGYPNHIPSSATSSTTMTASSGMSGSSSVTVEARRRPIEGSSDEENESPTKGPSASRAMMKMQIDEPLLPEGMPPNANRVPILIRSTRPSAVAPPSKAVIGGRTSAKFAEVAEDPGVEGIPPGPRPIDRPGPSFACIIGQAILRSSTGGLSLEHIYRYVETAYPFFKSGDAAWRNSVRHNLSIHKMFETIPRTEKFPPGKGGIWIIHEEEKIHWPSEDKFIKNFPSNHPHHSTCRQTLHEKQKEQEAIAKAKAEGREYVPKKGKKGRKLPGEDESMEMIRSNSQLFEGNATPHLLQPPLPTSRGPSPNPKVTPKTQVKALHPPPMPEHEFEDDGDFLPIESEAMLDSTMESESERELATYPTEMLPPVLPRGTMVPPRFRNSISNGLGRSIKRKSDEDENVFTAAPKRVRVSEPLAPIYPVPQETVVHDADSYVTPEREKTGATTKMTSTGSNFKTPALINTSSSPGSSPMPPTIGRSTNHHHPSALQQAWTTDDFEPLGHEGDSPPGGRPYALDVAFDLKPKMDGARRIVSDEEPFLPLVSPRGPPKTPLTRSSAATDRTPRPAFGANIRTPWAKTPLMFHGSPVLPLPSGIELSTPAWEINGVLDRLTGGIGIGMESPTRGIRSPGRSPFPSTDPDKYAFAQLLGLGSPKGKSMSLPTIGGLGMGRGAEEARSLTEEAGVAELRVAFQLERTEGDEVKS